MTSKGTNARVPILPILIALTAISAGLASEAARRIISGANYAHTTLNDLHYYTAMALRLWDQPLDFPQEVAFLQDDPAGAPFFSGLKGTDFGQTGYYWHLEDGLSHQPPYAYRVVGPSATGILHSIGLPITSADIVVYLVGVALLALFSYLIVGRTFDLSIRPLVISAGSCLAALATVSPGSPDMLYLGLATAAVWSAANDRALLFACLASLATATRETGLVLTASWLAYAWAGRRIYFARLLPAFAPIAVFIALRAVAVDVPNSSISHDELAQFVSSRMTPPLILGVCAIFTIGLITPRVMRFWNLESDPRVSIAELLLWLVGFIAALGGMLLASNTSRLALLSLPLFYAASGWKGARSPLWVASAACATIGYAVADTLANRADAPFGQEPWRIAAIVTLLLQVIALLIDRLKVRTRAV